MPGATRPSHSNVLAKSIASALLNLMTRLERSSLSRKPSMTLSQPRGQSTTAPRPTGTTHPSKPSQSAQSKQSNASVQPKESPSSTSSSVGQQARTTSSVTSISSPAISSDFMVTEGAVAVIGLVSLALAVQKGLVEVQSKISMLSQSRSPKADDVKRVLGTLHSTATSLKVLNKEAPMINMKSLSSETQKAIEGVKKGTMDTIANLEHSVKNPKTVDRDEIRKASHLLGQQGSITKQATAALKPLIDWKPPKGIGDIVIPGLLNLPSPSLGDVWKGTTVSSGSLTLSIPSPTVHWDQSILSDSSNFGNGGGGGGLLSSLFNLAKQAEGAVNDAAGLLTGADGLSSIAFEDVMNLVSRLTSAVQDVGGLGAGLEEIELDAFPPADISRVVGIRNANRVLYTEIKQTLNIVSQYITKPPQALQIIKEEVPKWVIGGTVITLLALSGSNPISSLPQIKTTGTPPKPPAPTESKEAKEDWFLISIPNSVEKDWMAFITSLPDKGLGPKQSYDWPVRRQTYVAKLTLPEAQAANRNRLVDQLVINRVKIILNNVTSRSTKSHKRKTSFAHGNVTELHRRTFAIQSRDNSPVHLKMLSANPHADISSVHVA
ncbi:MAG: hypothetical protein L6R35_006888, partial [Caloplaca aegaea]